MVKTKIFNEQNKPSESEKSEVVDFLFDNLQEYGDPKHQIERAIDYSTKEFTSFGGFTMVLMEEDVIRAAVLLPIKIIEVKELGKSFYRAQLKMPKEI